jgi:hypothetical protein
MKKTGRIARSGSKTLEKNKILQFPQIDPKEWFDNINRILNVTGQK